jgi:hypothetical protein
LEVLVVEEEVDWEASAAASSEDVAEAIHKN